MPRTLKDQADRIVKVLADWIHASPGRRVDLEKTPEGWRATLEESRSAHGATALDALAQVATVAEVETSERRR